MFEDEDVKRAELLKFRGKLEEDIEYLNKELIYTTADVSGMTRDLAREIRDELIECSNSINKYRLVLRGRDY